MNFDGTGSNLTHTHSMRSPVILNDDLWTMPWGMMYDCFFGTTRQVEWVCHGSLEVHQENKRGHLAFIIKKQREHYEQRWGHLDAEFHLWSTTQKHPWLEKKWEFSETPKHPVTKNQVSHLATTHNTALIKSVINWQTVSEKKTTQVFPFPFTRKVQK